MYKVALTIVTLLLLVLANHPKAHAAETAPAAVTSKTRGQIVNNPNKTVNATVARALSSQSSYLTTPISVYDVWFNMAVDTDGDGYYHQFEINFDVDTTRQSHSIYVIGELNGLTRQTLFQTEPYTLNGNSGSDTYQLTALLTDGYPASQYELILTIYDAETQAPLLQYDGQDNSQLQQLFLEDSGQESAQAAQLSLYEMSFELSDDRDQDGYYTTLRLAFDADAPGSQRWIYARISLIDGYGQWIEIHTTQPFAVTDYSSADRYATTIAMDYGINPEPYQLAVELYSAENHALLLSSNSPLSTPLKMESVDLDDAYGVTVEEEYYYAAGTGGGTGLLLLSALGILLLIRRYNKSEK